MDTFNVIDVGCVCEGMKINYSTEIVTVLRIVRGPGIMYLELSNNVKHCYKCGQLVRKYL